MISNKSYNQQISGWRFWNRIRPKQTKSVRDIALSSDREFIIACMSLMKKISDQAIAGFENNDHLQNIQHQTKCALIPTADNTAKA